MSIEELKTFIGEASGSLYRQNPDGFEKRHQLFERIRSSSLTAAELGTLRDSLPLFPGIAGERMTVIRSGIDGIYQEKVRNEDQESKPKVIRFIERHPTASVILWLASCVLCAVITTIVNIALNNPLSKWWAQFHP